MRILRLYLARETFLATLVVLLILLAVLLLFLLIDELGDLSPGYDIVIALAVVALKLPTWIVRIFPLALMIGTIFALGRLADQSELTVIRSSGISTNSILYSVLLAGLIPIICMLLMAEYVVPRSEFNAQNIYNAAHNKFLFQKTRYGVWLRNKDNFLHIGKMLSVSNMQDITYYKFSKNQLQKAISAPNGRIDNNGMLYFYQPQTYEFTRTAVKTHQDKILVIKTGMSPHMLAQIQIEPNIQASKDLLEQRNYLKQNLFDTTQIDYALWSRLSYPFTSFLMLFLAFPFVLGSNRIKTASQRIFTGIMVGLVFFTISRILEQIGLLYYVPGWFSYFAPIVMFFILGLVLYRRTLF